MPKTVALANNEEKLNFCSEHKDMKAKYYCQDVNCEYHKVQPYYCEECMCPERHEHMGMRLALLVTKCSEMWKYTGNQVALLG